MNKLAFNHLTPIRRISGSNDGLSPVSDLGLVEDIGIVIANRCGREIQLSIPGYPVADSLCLHSGVQCIAS